MKKQRVLVTGATGFLGRHLLKCFEQEGKREIIGISSQDFNLMDMQDVNRCLSDIKPDVIVHLAAYVGGIGANIKYPADLYYQNAILVANMFESAAKHKISKMIYTFGGCSYPATVRSPISEEDLWDGYPQVESAPYSIAKKSGVLAALAYRQQYNLNSTVLIPGNMYGEYDNFQGFDSHVIPAMIRRFFETKLAGAHQITLWGTGKPSRDFVYAGDVAETIPFFIDSYDACGPINISTATKTSIYDLAYLLSDLTEFSGEILWDSSKPDGQQERTFSIERLKNLGLTCSTSLHEGLHKTVTWFKEHYKEQTDGLRL